MKTETHKDTFAPRTGHISAALYQLRKWVAQPTVKATHKRAEALLCEMGYRLQNGEAVTLANLEKFLLSGARDWKHYAESVGTGAEVCQETILRDFYETDQRTAEEMVKKMYAGNLANDFCVKVEGRMLKTACLIVKRLLEEQAEQYEAAQRIARIHEEAGKSPANKEIFFAFGNAQFKEELEKSGLKISDIVSFGAGLYGTRKGIKAFLNGIDSALEPLKEESPDFVFAYEFANHECGYTGDFSEALRATRNTFKDYTPSEKWLNYLFNETNEEFALELANA